MVQQYQSDLLEETREEIIEADDWNLNSFEADNTPKWRPVPEGIWYLELVSIEQPKVKTKFNKDGKQQQSRFFWKVIGAPGGDTEDVDGTDVVGREMSTFYSLSMNRDSNLVKFVVQPMIGEPDPKKTYKPSDFRGGVIKATVKLSDEKTNTKGQKVRYPYIESAMALSAKERKTLGLDG